MKTTIEYLNEVGAKYPVAKNDNRLAELIGITRQAISQYRMGEQNMNPYVAARVAYILEISPLETIAATMYHQAKNMEEKIFWKNVYEQYVRKAPSQTLIDQDKA